MTAAPPPGPKRGQCGAPQRPRRRCAPGYRCPFDPTLCGVEGPFESLTFEELLGALELVTGRLANGELGIEAAAGLYEQAEILYSAAQERLAAVEARINRMRGPGRGPGPA